MQGGQQLARLGALPLEPGRVEFRVWAPAAHRVETAVGVLEPEGDGVFSAQLPAQGGSDYRFRLDGGAPLNDPCSSWQPEGLRGPSRVLDTSAFDWSAEPVPLRLESLVIYELHVGTFTAEGMFDAAIARLAGLAELGVTAVELMPVATFAGERGWGYDGVLSYAPHRAYGGPHGLARFVDAAHRLGLGVILDVVYNHVGPGAELLAAYGPYFTHRHPTRWGDAIDYSRRAVREWAIQNAELWVRDYRIDGLRLDATDSVFDDGEPHIMAELAARVHAAHPGALVIAEIGRGDRRPLEQWGHDAQWADGFHHALHSVLTGERDGYYAPYGKVADLARASQRDAFRGAARDLRSRITTRSATAPTATACRRPCGSSPPRACSSRRRCRCCSWVRSTARRRRSSSSPTTTTPRSRRPRAREGGVSSPPSPRSRARMFPTRRRVAPSSARCCSPQPATRACARSAPSSSRSARSCRPRSRPVSTSASASLRAYAAARAELVVDFVEPDPPSCCVVDPG